MMSILFSYVYIFVLLCLYLLYFTFLSGKTFIASFVMFSKVLYKSFGVCGVLVFSMSNIFKACKLFCKSVVDSCFFSAIGIYVFFMNIANN